MRKKSAAEETTKPRNSTAKNARGPEVSHKHEGRPTPTTTAPAKIATVLCRRFIVLPAARERAPFSCKAGERRRKVPTWNSTCRFCTLAHLPALRSDPSRLCPIDGFPSRPFRERKLRLCTPLTRSVRSDRWGEPLAMDRRYAAALGSS